VVFVCTGNICRSPMAEFIARRRAKAELDFPVRFTSAGTSSEEEGNPIDGRAARQLAADGYPSGGHVAHLIETSEILDADLVIGAERHHVASLRRRAPEAGDKIRLLSEFDPHAPEGQGIPDPWYGGMDGFRQTSAMIEAALDGLFDELRAMHERRESQT
jgi:protein-tyrosine phosphatase